MKRCHVIGLLLCLVFTAHVVAAQVPGLLNYQGRVAVEGTNFTGTGQFKFALVNGAKLLAGGGSGPLYASTDSGMTWTALSGSPGSGWRSTAASADGVKLVAVSVSRPIYTSSPSSRPGVAGYLLGGENAAIELLSIGNGQFLPISHEGTLQAY